MTDAAREDWSDICTRIMARTPVLLKSTKPCTVARNIKQLDDLGKELDVTHKNVKGRLTTLINKGVTPNQDEARLQYMQTCMTKISDEYSEMLMTLGDAATTLAEMAEPETPETTSQPTSLYDPLDPRQFTARTPADTFDISKGHAGWSVWKTSWEAYKTTSGLAALTEGSGDRGERTARKAKLLEMEWSLFWMAMKPSWDQLTPIVPINVREGKRTEECIKLIDTCMEANTSYRLARRDFGRRWQGENEPMQEWVATITNMAAMCKFEEMCPRCNQPVNTLDSRVAEQIITGVHDPELARRYVELPNKATLEDIKHVGRTYEMSKKVTLSYSKNTTTTNRVAANKSGPPRQDRTPSGGSHAPEKPRGPEQDCKNCKYNHKPGQCPAKTRKCFRCGRVGHMIDKCTKPDTRNTHQTTGTAPPQAQAVDHGGYTVEPDPDAQNSRPQAQTMAMSWPRCSTIRPGPTPEPLTKICVRFQPTTRPADTPTKIEALPDTGSNVDVLPAHQLSQLGMARKDLRDWRNPPPAPVTAAGMARWSMWGTLEATITRKGQTTNRHVYVIDGAETPLLSKAALVDLGLIPVNWPCDSPQAGAARTQAQAQRH